MNNIIQEIQIKLNKPTNETILDFFTRNRRISTRVWKTASLTLVDYPTQKTLVLTMGGLPLAIRTNKKFAYVSKLNAPDSYVRQKTMLLKKLKTALVDYEYVPQQHLKRIIREIEN